MSSPRPPDYLERQDAWKTFRTIVLHDYPAPAVVAWMGLFTAGLATIGWAVVRLLDAPWLTQAQTGLLVAGAAVGGYYAVRARKPATLFIGGDLFAYAALALHGAAAGIIVAVADILAPSSRSGYRLSARILTPFVTATSFAAASGIYSLLGSELANIPEPIASAVRLCLAGGTAMALQLLMDETLRALKRKRPFSLTRVALEGYQGLVLPLACSVIVALLSLVSNTWAMLAGCAGAVAFVLYALRRWPVAPVVSVGGGMPVTDAVTGATLRTAFTEQVAEAQRSAEAGVRHCFAIVCIGCDVGAVNRNLGYAAGEEYLAMAARRLRHEIRDVDVLGRTAIDTFAVLLRTVTGPADSKAIAQRLLDVVSKPMDLDGMLIQSAASVGVASSWAVFDRVSAGSAGLTVFA
jgi:diguanylate cyclase (GGDEF)-like protein